MEEHSSASIVDSAQGELANAPLEEAIDIGYLKGCWHRWPKDPSDDVEMPMKNDNLLL